MLISFLSCPFCAVRRPISACQGHFRRRALLARVFGERPSLTFGGVLGAVNAANEAVLEPVGGPDLAAPGEVEEAISVRPGASLARPGVGDGTGGDGRAAGAPVGHVAGGHAAQWRIR